MGALEDDIDSALAAYGLDDDLFAPLTPPNPAAPKPKCRRHQWFKVSKVIVRVSDNMPVGTEQTGEIACYRCGAVKDDAASRRGRLNKNRGNSIEREIGKKLGMKRVGQFGGKDDLSNAVFAAQVKSGGAFSERQWAWLKAVPVVAGQTALLVVADTPGPGKKRRGLVILDLDDWRDLHGVEV